MASPQPSGSRAIAGVSVMIESVVEMETARRTARSGFPQTVRAGSVGRSGSYSRFAGVPLVMGVWGGIVGIPVDLAGRVPSQASNVRALHEGEASPLFAAGPQTGVWCPVGAISISPGTNIQTVLHAYPGSTTFCLKAGVHPIASAITPKTGNTFVGEYGAILDGTGWTTTDTTQAAFRAHNQDIDNVTIRNLVIRNMPQTAIHAFRDSSDYWTIDHNEIDHNLNGVAVGNHSVVSYNYIHHNTGNPDASSEILRGGGYSAYRATSTTFSHNEIAYNGPEQKITETANVTFQGNFVHHNFNGIWFDGDNTGAVIEGNRVEDNGRVGIFYEISGQGIIRNNTIRRNAEYGIFISTSKNVETYGNTVEDNLVGIEYFLDCELVGGGTIGFDLANNYAHDNSVRVGTTSGSYANGFVYLSSCPSTQVAPYLNGSKNLTFENHRYTVPALTTRYWFWGLGSPKDWSEWQALRQDAAGTVGQ
jgi:parallel beta-helix repeat protein